MTGTRAGLTQLREALGSSDEGCSILHVDMDAFFASVELVSRPQLRGRPVIVGGSERSVVLAATYEARAYGVHSAMPMSQARRLCPQAVVLPPDLPKYREVSHRIMESLRSITGLVEQLSVDEAFLDVSGARRRLGSPSRIAEAIRESVRGEHGITCSVGVASTKFVAKIASVHAKPDGMLVIPEHAAVRFLRSLHVRSLWGVGERTAQALARYGINTVAELADSDVEVVKRAVGRSSGAHLHDLAWGRDTRAVEPTRTERSVGAESTFTTDTSDSDEIRRQLLVLSDRCTSRLRAQGLLTRTVSIKVRTSDFKTLNRSRALTNPSDSCDEVFRIAHTLFEGVDLMGLPVRLVGVRAEGLVKRASTAIQPTLEESFTGTGERRREAETTIDLIRNRFGRSAIAIGSDVRAPTTIGRNDELS